MRRQGFRGKLRVCCFVGCLWGERNNIIFRGLDRSLSDIWACIRCNVSLWRRTLQVTFYLIGGAYFYFSLWTSVAKALFIYLFIPILCFCYFYFFQRRFGYPLKVKKIVFCSLFPQMTSLWKCGIFPFKTMDLPEILDPL